MENPWAFFKEIYVINLAHRTDRRHHIQTHFAQFPGLQYSFVEAVNGSDSKYIIEYAANKGVIPSEPHMIKMDKPQIACLLSHYRVWEQTLLKVPNESPGHWILVFEDDIEFHPTFNNQVLEKYLKHLPADAMFFKWVYQNAKTYSKVTPVNSHWNKLEEITFSMMAYAVHTDWLIHLLMNRYTNPLDWYPIHRAYGFRDMFEEGNDGKEFFEYFYHYTQQGTVYRYTGIYSGVGRSYKKDTDSNINAIVRSNQINHSLVPVPDPTVKN